jgi:hypothetical protein
MIPSLEALRYHWFRSCWILHLWQQAQCNHMQLAPLQGHGWTRDRDGKFDIYRRKQVQSEEQGRLTNEGVQL